MDEAKSWQSIWGQTSALANGHLQRALGEVTWECTLQGCTNPLRLFIMRDEDSTHFRPRVPYVMQSQVEFLHLHISIAWTEGNVTPFLLL